MIIIDRIDLAIKELKSRYLPNLDITFTVHLNKADYDELSTLNKVVKYSAGDKKFNCYEPDEFPQHITLILATPNETDISWLESYYKFIVPEDKEQKERVVV